MGIRKQIKAASQGMSHRKCMYTALLSTLVFTLTLSAQNGTATHHIYKLMPVGTFGGLGSGITVVAGGSFGHIINRRGATIGLATTNIPDPKQPHCFANSADCYVAHALEFQGGKLTDLGALAGPNSSASYALNDHGLIVGLSETGLTDPLTNLPAYDAVVWRNGVMNDLGTLGGSLSQAIDVNNHGQVVGVSSNAIPDKYAGGLGPCNTWFGCRTVATQQRAFLWEGTGLQDLGTLGGSSAIAYLINQHGQVAGVSFTNTTPNTTTGLPTQDPFLWDQGSMVDIGGLGGTYGTAHWLNNKGQVVGNSYLAGDKVYHAFSWQAGTITDLGTLGGAVSTATSLNDQGEVVGYSLLKDNANYHAFIWGRNGAKLQDLGVAPGYPDGVAYGINAIGQTVGLIATGPPGPTTAVAAAIWENGGIPADLNLLLEAPSDWHVDQAYAIGDSGIILAFASLGNQSSIVELEPVGFCDSSCEAAIAANQDTKETPKGSGWQAPQFSRTRSN